MNPPDAAYLRVITTLGHVDHGKTTLMDALLAANNIISSKMAGKMRYLDSREDEQERGITMESSAISLKFQATGANESEGRSPKTYIITMIDTPGHVDFSSEVSTASRLCDGALILVDVVEGVCTQTIAVLRQAWQDRLKPILVINKFDRLITELKLSPVEAYHHLSRLIEQVNAVMGTFFAGDRMEDDLRWREERERRLAIKKELRTEESDNADNEADEFQEKDDEDIYFSPDRGNIIFASALDGWGLRVGKFAKLYADKLGMKEANLRRVLWGDFFLDPKTKKIISSKHLRGRVLKPLFVQFVLENIWAVYDAAVVNPNSEKITRIISALNLRIAPKDIKSKDHRHLLSSILMQWLSLSTCIIQAVIDVVPTPSVAQATRIPKMLYPDIIEATIPPKNKLEADLYASKPGADAYVVAYVTKMFAVSERAMPENKTTSRATENSDPAPTGRPLYSEASDEDGEVILGFARLYSGTLRIGTKVCGVLPKYNVSFNPDDPRNINYLVTAAVEGLYIMMGRELVAVDSVRAGNVFALKGLDGKVWRSATLCSPDATGIGDGLNFNLHKDCLINLGGLNHTVQPIVRIAVEPVMPADMPKLVRGLKLLSRSDPCVETFQQATGEQVILGAGELHLERCLKDLRERFARVQIQASKPIVPFRETAILKADMNGPRNPNFPRGSCRGSSSHEYVRFTIRATPLPRPILSFILENLATLKQMQNEHKPNQDHALYDVAQEEQQVVDVHGGLIQTPSVKPEQFWAALEASCEEAGGTWTGIAEKIWSFGPQKAGGCVLIDARNSKKPNSFKHGLARNNLGEIDETSELTSHDFDSDIETGFQLATFQGPLCAEPVEGMAYFLESLEIDNKSIETEIEQNRLPQITGSLISAVKDACRNGLLDWSPRLMLAMYICDIQTSTEVLGKVYGVVAQRRGRIIAEEMKEGTSFFNVTALLPVVESFGFAHDIRKRTSGAASPQLIFKGYELLDQDPFWVPSTEEELEELGEKADRSNVAKGYMDAVRERKGLPTDKKLVENAEKQRTLKK